jgi:hypothetical protein
MSQILVPSLSAYAESRRKPSRTESSFSASVVFVEITPVAAKMTAKEGYGRIAGTLQCFQSARCSNDSPEVESHHHLIPFFGHGVVLSAGNADAVSYRANGWRIATEICE